MEDRSSPRLPISGLIVIGIFLFFMMLGGCFKQSLRDGPPAYDIDVSRIKNPVPHYLPKSAYGNPSSYIIGGKRYHVLKSTKHYEKRGMASWYGTKFHGQLTSTRERYNMFDMTAASPELPIPCFVRVTNLGNGKEVIVKVNDRGPFASNRIIDLSYAAAKKLGYEKRGTAMVEVTSINSDDPYQETIKHYAQHKQPQLYLQVGAFSALNNAERLKIRLEDITTKPVRIQRRASHGLYHVQIGPLNNLSESHLLQRAINHAKLGKVITVVG